MKFANNDINNMEKTATPFDMKKKGTDTKPVRLDKDLHQILKMYSGYGDQSMVDMVNEAVEEYIQKNDIKQKIKDRNNQL